MQKQQQINCNVKSCAHNQVGEYCRLNSILVAPLNNGNSGKPADESMCSDYRNKPVQG